LSVAGAGVVTVSSLDGVGALAGALAAVSASGCFRGLSSRGGLGRCGPRLL